MTNVKSPAGSRKTQADRERLIEENAVINPPKLQQKRKMSASKASAPKDREYPCFSCGKEYTKREGNFPVSPHSMFKGNDGYTHMCRSCTAHYLAEYEQMFDNDGDAAVRHLGMYLGYYVSDSAVNASNRVNSKQNRIFSLASSQGMKQAVGKNYDNYIMELREQENTKIESVEDLKELGNTKITQKMLKFWGAGYEPEEYVFLNDKYDDWTSRHECKTKAQESIFQKICLIELQITKAIQNGDKIDGLMRAFNDQLGSANIRPVQNKDNSLADQNTFGTLIQKWETERPVPEPDPEWQDVDGIRKYVSTWFLGHLCKMLNIKNKYSLQYEEEISKYTVEQPEYDDDGELAFDSIFKGEESVSEDGDL